MSVKTSIRKILGSALHRYGYELMDREHLYDWQKESMAEPRHNPSPLPSDAAEYLHPEHPRLKALQASYTAFNTHVTAPLVWTDTYIQTNDMRYFRGDNAYVWQLRGDNMNPLAYALTMYYVRSNDTLGLLARLEEDSYFGNFTFRIDNKIVSRDLLDSIMEIHFLERHLSLSHIHDLNILDIGAGYGRLAHRMVRAIPNMTRYLCTDGVAMSTFLSEYYLKFRQIDGTATVVPLDIIEHTLAERTVDIAINIHSFSECTLSAIEWWVSLLEERGVKHLMIVPNAGTHGGERLLTNDGKDFGAVIEQHGYRLVAKDPKYRDPLVQQYAIGPTYYYLFELQSSRSRKG